MRTLGCLQRDYSTWEVNPPNPTGMHHMMVTCMNDQDRFWTRGRQSSIQRADGTKSDVLQMIQIRCSTIVQSVLLRTAFMPNVTGYVDTTSRT